jgi:hypothetical protein
MRFWSARAVDCPSGNETPFATPFRASIRNRHFMNIFVSVLCSVLLSAGIFVALLALVRSRLGRQFTEIERRLGHVEKLVREIKTGQGSESVSEQLKRLHKGLVRLQENTARRYGPLIPLAEEMRDNVAEQRRFLGDYAISRLEGWAAELGLSISRARVLELAREVARLDEKVDAPDFMALLAALIALQAWREDRLAVALDDAQPAWLRKVLCHSRSLGEIEVCSSPSDVDVVLLFALQDAGPIPAKGGAVILGANEDAPTDIPGCTLVAAGEGVMVYKKAALPDS